MHIGQCEKKKSYTCVCARVFMEEPKKEEKVRGNLDRYTNTQTNNTNTLTHTYYIHELDTFIC